MNNFNGPPGSRTHFLIWRFCAAAGPIFLVGLGLSWALVAGFLPPPAEFWSPAEVSQYFSDHSFRIRLGMVAILFFGPFLIPWSALISRIIRRIEGPDGVLATIELMGGVGTTLAVVSMAVSWETASFRVELRTPQSIQLLSDMGWFFFDLSLMVTLFQMVGFGTAILLDSRKVPLFPGWLAWLTYAACLLFFPVYLIPFLQRGPFAWHGLISFYVVVTPFFVWGAIMCYYVFRAVGMIEKEVDLS